MNVEAVKVENGFLIPLIPDFLRLGKDREVFTTDHHFGQAGFRILLNIA